MKIVFMGTPDFSLPTLKYLIENHEVVGIFTQPDRPKGRGKKLAPPPIKEFAGDYDIPVFQPERIKTNENIQILRDLNPELIIVVAYGQILSSEILEMPVYGCINVHASLLPELRGASPINTAIVRGLKETGVTTMRMDVGLDSGDMLLKKIVKIDGKMNAGELHDILMMLGVEVLKDTLENIDKIKPIPQDHDKATHAPIIKKKMAEIDWKDTSVDICNLIRGYNPWPVAYTSLDGKRMKIFESSIEDFKSDEEAGIVVNFDKNGLLVQTGDKVINIQEIQLPGGKRMSIDKFASGYKIENGTKLGE
ncbi:MAG: methionyl-tRNA formyltransferase [Bacillota bacterium]|nr:methionyl-tRNA formyltransferase [Bacillota bacterium]